MAARKQANGSNARIKRKRVTMTFEAPHAKAVSLLGDFNEWNEKKHPMKKGKQGIWEKVIIVPQGQYEYRFKVDGHWHNDPANQRVCANAFGGTNNILDVK